VAGAAPPNDDFADAILLTGTSGVVDVTVVDATYEPGELTPRHPEVSPGHFTGSVWWKLVAPSDGSLAVTSTGDTGGFDQVAVSTGPTVDDQTYHTASSIAPTSRQSWHVLNLPVEAGETYYVS